IVCVLDDSFQSHAAEYGNGEQGEAQSHRDRPKFIIAWKVVEQGIVEPFEVFAPGEHQGNDRDGQKDVPVCNRRIEDPYDEKEDHDCRAVNRSARTWFVSPVGRGASYKIIDFGRRYAILPQRLFGS